MTTKNLGPGVSGYLNPDGRAWETTVFQAGKPVLDKELNLQQDVDGGAGQLALRLAMRSGWISEDFLNTSDMSGAIFISSANPNEYHLPSLTAHVNGWVIPVTDTGKNDTTNAVDLGAPPVGAGVKRTDLVILEVWRKLLSPAPSLDGKSPSGRIWRNGNVKIAAADDGALNFQDDIKDVTLGAESTKRVQIQYRLRVIQGVDIFAYPYGLDDPSVVAFTVPPNAATPDGVLTLFNYVKSATDSGLWVAGDGIPTNTLGTVDGFMYAIPLTAIFRRNSTAFSRTTNQAGGVVFPGPTTRPDGFFSDIVVARDVADLRLGVNPGGWDFSEVLAKNWNALLDNKIRTEWMNGPPVMGGGSDGHTILVTDEIGISTANGGVPPNTGDAAGGVLIGQFDATRRFFSDRAITETVVVRVAAPGGGWLTGSVVTVQPSALEIPPYAPFNWTAYNSASVLFADIKDAYFLGVGVGKKTLRASIATVTGFNAMPIGPLTVTIGNIVGSGLTDEDLFLTLVVSYPRGEGLSMTPTGTFAGSIEINNPAQLPALAPVSYSALSPSNSFDFPHREVQLQYQSVNITTAVFQSNSKPPGPYDSFQLTERASSIVTVLKNAVPIVGTVAISSDGRTITFNNPVDFTVPGDTLQVTYVAIRPLPQNDEQLSIYYEARAPQALRSSTLGLRIDVIPRCIAPDVFCLSVGSGSQDEAYPFPSGYVQMGGIYPTSAGTFNGDHELAAGAALSVTNFSSKTGLLKLPTFVGYTPAPEEVAFIRGGADTDIEGRSYFNLPVFGAYIPNAFSQELSDAKRHRNILPMIAELVSDSMVGQKGQLVLILLVREAFFDALNGVFFEPLLIDTTTAAVFHLKGRLLNK